MWWARLFCKSVCLLKLALKGSSLLMIPWQPVTRHHQGRGFCVCLFVNIHLCLSSSCSLQHCLSRTSPCMLPCLYPIRMPCTSQEEGLWAARPWQQLQPLWMTVGCSPLHRPPCTGMRALVEAPRGPPVQAVQVSGQHPQSIGQSGNLRTIQTTLVD